MKIFGLRLAWFAWAVLLFSCEKEVVYQEMPLTAGMVIRENVRITPGTYLLPAPDTLGTPVVTIEGEGITVDFNGAVLVGSSQPDRPDLFGGVAIKVAKGKDITVKNAVVRHYKIGLLATDIEELTLQNNDFSYHYRQRLGSTRQQEDLNDWLYYHHNEQDEWMRYGAGVYLKNCPRATVRELTVTGGQNGLMLVDCNEGEFFNNTLHFNSGIGIGLYRSSGNKVMHNRLDWNVRGYSHGVYQRGQDSAGILVYEQSSKNTFAYNSATHSGDGFFLWAGQHTMDTGEGGCNDNLIYGNDFSHAPTNGIEVTFSRNQLIANRIEECRYGIWGGYSYQTVIAGNFLKNNQFGIAIEHGQENQLLGNVVQGDSVGVWLWQRDTQPADWGYAQKKNTSNVNSTLSGNIFRNVGTAFRLGTGGNISVKNNIVIGGQKVFEAASDLTGWQASGNVAAGDVALPDGWRDANKTTPDTTDLTPPAFPDGDRLVKKAPYPMGDGMNAMLPDSHPRGRSYIMVDEWGPYDFRSPLLWLQSEQGGKLSFALYGPAGRWRVLKANGLSRLNSEQGTAPGQLQADIMGAEGILLEIEYTCQAGGTDRFGRPIPAGQPMKLRFERAEILP